MGLSLNYLLFFSECDYLSVFFLFVQIVVYKSEFCSLEIQITKTYDKKCDITKEHLLRAAKEVCLHCVSVTII